MITNSPQSFKWYGLTLLISEGTLPEGVDECTVSIKASMAGQYQFPEDIQLVSAIFLLRCEPKCKFAKPINMEMEHCAAKSANVSKLSFMKAFCTQKTLPYVFKKIGGHFTEDLVGTVELNSFSMVATGQEGCQRQYGASIFYLIHQRNISSYCLKIDVVVTWNTEAHLNVSTEFAYIVWF